MNFFEKSYAGNSEARAEWGKPKPLCLDLTSWRTTDANLRSAQEYGWGTIGNFVLSQFTQQIERPASLCESPIEQAMFLALTIVGMETEFPVLFGYDGEELGFTDGREPLVITSDAREFVILTAPSCMGRELRPTHGFDDPFHTLTEV